MTEQLTSVALPERLSIFPLPGVLLLPGGKLPLNIFEPRYLDMTRDAMAGSRMIGMIQPLDPGHESHTPPVYETGGAGLISSFRETDDGRFLITLAGICRFRVKEELEVGTRYRQVIPDWQPFAADLEGEDDSAVDRDRLLPALKAFLKCHEILADWNAIEKAPSCALVNYLSMICPFEPSEKQALLEASDLVERSRVMTALIEMSVLQKTAGRDSDTSAH